MFNDNWFLFILIVLLMFSDDGELNEVETSVILAICLVLACKNPACSGLSQTTT
ncbi:MAG: hypothetical protein SPG87_02780 [Eubacteriales bacterium]|nr:hypothetical protein [Eubacteriales bacterium]